MKTIKRVLTKTRPDSHKSQALEQHTLRSFALDPQMVNHFMLISLYSLKAVSIICLAVLFSG